MDCPSDGMYLLQWKSEMTFKRNGQISEVYENFGLLMARRQWSNDLWDGGLVIRQGQGAGPLHEPQIT